MSTSPEASEAKSSAMDRAISYARAHPGTAIITATGIGLFGGVEVAAAVLFGAAIATVVGTRDTATLEHARSLRARTRTAIDSVRTKIASVVHRTRTETGDAPSP
jgi:ElaB/YqjD/DUF883 family membrane-anchored ribosome-binding protein